MEVSWFQRSRLARFHSNTQVMTNSIHRHYSIPITIHHIVVYYLVLMYYNHIMVSLLVRLNCQQVNSVSGLYIMVITSLSYTAMLTLDCCCWTSGQTSWSMTLIWELLNCDNEVSCIEPFSNAQVHLGVTACNLPVPHLSNSSEYMYDHDLESTVLNQLDMTKDMFFVLLCCTMLCSDMVFCFAVMGLAWLCSHSS